jgi:hypothetical protein
MRLTGLSFAGNSVSGLVRPLGYGKSGRRRIKQMVAALDFGENGIAAPNGGMEQMIEMLEIDDADLQRARMVEFLRGAQQQRVDLGDEALKPLLRQAQRGRRPFS